MTQFRPVQLMDQEDIDRALTRMAHQIRERNAHVTRQADSPRYAPTSLDQSTADEE